MCLFSWLTASNVYKSCADASFNATPTLAMNCFTQKKPFALPIESDSELAAFIHLEFEFMNKFCYGRKCGSLLVCKYKCDPSLSRRVDMRACIQCWMFLDALQCSSIKFHRSFFVESNKAILPINCMIPKLPYQAASVRGYEMHDRRSWRTQAKITQNCQEFSSLALQCAPPAVRTCFLLKANFSVNERTLWSDKRNEFVSIFYINVIRECSPLVSRLTIMNSCIRYDVWGMSMI